MVRGGGGGRISLFSSILSRGVFSPISEAVKIPPPLLPLLCRFLRRGPFESGEEKKEKRTLQLDAKKRERRGRR